MRRPIEIVGGGLSGLSLGVALRRAGVPVTVFESGRYPRHRVCGEFINGLSAGTIRALGLEHALADAALNRDVAWSIDDRIVRLQQLSEPAFGISRHRLDARLAAQFVALGGELKTDRRVGDTAGESAGRVLAFGRRRARSHWIGLKIHALDFPIAGHLEVHLGDRAYVGAARIEDGRVNLCGLFQLRGLNGRGVGLLSAYLRAAGLHALDERLREAGTDPDSFCAVAALQFDASVRPTPELRLGDACAMIPPFTGNGMAMAFQSAECALTPLLAYAHGGASWSATRVAVHDALRARFRTRLAAARCTHPFMLQPGLQSLLKLANRTRLVPLQSLHAVLR